jgi:hypothetical protein
MQVYKKFLIGSKVCEKVLVTTLDQLETLAEVALTHPMSLQQLREVHNGGDITASMVYTDLELEMKDFINKYLKVKLSALHLVIH